jgi:hypothetical protein
MPTLYDFPHGKKPLFRAIGDVHGRLDGWHFLANNARASIQLGDLSVNYDAIKQQNPRLDPMLHRVVLGNHDNYHNRPKPYDLGDYGTYDVHDFGRIFFVRGGYSLDWQSRTAGRDFFPEEELSEYILEAAYNAYVAVKPLFVVTHECPESIREEVPYNKIKINGVVPDIHTRTAYWLAKMFESHKPKYWLFGHYHVLWQQVLSGTRFMCLGELDFADFTEQDRDEIYKESS